MAVCLLWLTVHVDPPPLLMPCLNVEKLFTVLTVPSIYYYMVLSLSKMRRSASSQSFTDDERRKASNI